MSFLESPCTRYVRAVINSAGEIADSTIVAQVQQEKNFSAAQINASINELLNGKSRDAFERNPKNGFIKLKH